MIKPDEVPLVVPADVAEEVRKHEIEIDKELVASGGTAMRDEDPSRIASARRHRYRYYADRR